MNDNNSGTRIVKAGLFALTIACFFMGILELNYRRGGSLKVSMYDLVKGLFEAEIFKYVSDLPAEVNLVLILLLGILIVTFCSIISAIQCLVTQNPSVKGTAASGFISVLILYILLIIGSDEINRFLGVSKATEPVHLTFILWIGAYLLILILPDFSSYTESYDSTYSNESAYSGGAMDSSAGANSGGFDGAIVVKNGAYMGKAYPLSPNTAAYLSENAGKIIASPHHTSNTMVSIYYVKENQQYCVIPYIIGAVFLVNGQVLESRKTYMLPRGSVIYIGSNMNIFELA